MRKDVSLPPHWQPTSVICPKCHGKLLASFTSDTHSLTAFICHECGWTQNFVQIAANRAKRLKRIARRNPPSKTLQSDFPKQPPK